MKYHFDSKLVLNPESKHKSLYTWSISEVAESAGRVVANQIPWPWTLYFALQDVQLFSSITLDRYGSPDPEMPTVQGKSFIRAKLVAGLEGWRDTSYSMFGTSRRIQDFTLSIYPVAKADEEGCTAWGCVSYTSETDFREETQDDSIGFYLNISNERFEDLSGKINAGAIGGGRFRVGGVAGFYSDWSPSISTNHVKVLTHGVKDHPVEIPEGCEIEPPRLGKVGEFDLTVWNAPLATPDGAVAGANNDEGEVASVPAPRNTLPIFDPKALAVLKSLRLAAWILVVALLYLVIK